MTDEEFTKIMREKGYPDNVIESTKSLIMEEAGGIDNFLPVPKVTGFDNNKNPKYIVGYSTTNGNVAWDAFNLRKRNFKDNPVTQEEALDMLLYNFNNPVTNWNLKEAGNIDPERLKSVMSLGYLADANSFATPAYKALKEGKPISEIPVPAKFTHPAEKTRWEKHSKIVSGKDAEDYLKEQMPKPTPKIEDFWKDSPWEEIFPAIEQKSSRKKAPTSNADRDKYLLELEKQLGITPRDASDNNFDPKKELDALYMEKFKR